MTSSPDPRSLRVSLALVRAARLLVPSPARPDWLREWEAELRYGWQRLGDRPGWSGQATLVRRALGAAGDAFWLRRQANADWQVLQDVRHGVRLLRHQAGFTALAVLMLAVGIGASAAIFSVVDALMLRDLPYRDAGRIVTLWQRDAKLGGERGDVAPGNFLDWKEQTTSFEAIAAVVPWSHDYTDGPEPVTLRGAQVTEGFFRALGTDALHGRTFLPSEHVAGQTAVAVLSHGCWMRRFGGDVSVVGRKVMLDGDPTIIVGILSPQFQPNLLQGAEQREVWSPKIVQDYERRQRGGGYWNVVARIKPGVSIEQVREELGAVAARLGQQYPRTNRSLTVEALPLAEHLIGAIRKPLLVLLGAVGLLVLIACANVANLLLARGARRRQEVAIRAALGASRARLVRQLLTESLVLAAMGCVLGLGIAKGMVDVVVALAPADVPRIDQVHLDLRVAVFAAALSMLTALLFGSVPALSLSRSDAHDALADASRGSSAGTGRRRLRGALVIAEVALAVVLLVSAGLLVRSFITLMNVDPGFTRQNVLALQVFTYGEKYRTADQQVAFYRQTLDRLSALPGVEKVGAVSAMPFIAANINIESPFQVEGRVAARAEEQPSTFLTIATSGYFSTMSVPLIRGRLFTDQDRATTPPVALVSDAMTRRHWPSEDPIGQRITVRWQGKPRTVEIVGIVGQVRHDGLDREPRPEVFMPHAQLPFGSMTFVVRTAGDAAGVMKAAKSVVWAIDPMLPFYDTATVEQLVAVSLAPRRFSLVLLGVFATIALVLAVVGLYGVISFSAAQRTREIGVRMALGARFADIRRLVVFEGLWLAAIGIGIGLAAALVATRFLESLLFGVTPSDPITLGLVAVLLFGVALLASYLPARRAARIDPLTALRVE